jgi:hypothetical protein
MAARITNDITKADAVVAQNAEQNSEMHATWNAVAISPKRAKLILFWDNPPT